MSGTLIALVTAKVKLAALITVAMTAGASGAVYAVTSAAPSTVTVTAATATGTTHAKPGHMASAKPKKADKPEKTDAGDDAAAGGLHGACVSAVAQDKKAVGGRNNNHGGAVSLAAHSCNGHAAKPKKTGLPGDKGKSSDRAKPTHAS
jgi:hypothetical protein